MADSDFNAVRPIESLQTVHSLTPIERRQERKRQQMPQDSREESEQEPNDADEPDEVANDVETPDDDQHLVDFCA